MAKTSSIEKNNRRRKMTKKFAAKRARLKAIAYDKERPLEERFEAQLKLAQLPRNSSATRIRNRCEVTGRAARVLPQAQDEPHRDAGSRLQGPDPGPGQVELVRRHDERQ